MPTPVHKSALAPTYSRDIREHNIIAHIGVGGFHRSHQALYTHELLLKSDSPRWAICGVGLMSFDKVMADALREQDHMYSVISQGECGISVSVVGSIMDFVLGGVAAASSEIRTRHLLAPRDQPADQEIMSSHLAAGRAAGRSGGEDRIAHGHRKGLLPRRRRPPRRQP